MAEPVLSVHGLHFSYPDGTVALRGVDFELSEGESVSLLGRNGSGKTTFVLHLNGLLRPTKPAGIVVNGLTASSATLPEIRRRVGVVFQDADDQLFMPTVLADVAFGPRNAGVPQAEAEDRARAALLSLGMVEGYDRAPWHLSAGEKRRVAIAGVLTMNPMLLVLDEPTTFLDPPGRIELAHCLRNLPVAKLVVTHDSGFAIATTSRAVFFEQGRIVDDGPVVDVLQRQTWDSRFIPI